MERKVRKRNLRISTVKGSYRTVWEELKVQAPKPLRRCNHSACIINNKLLVYGGQDITEGMFSDIWALNISPYEPLTERWCKINYTGDSPGPLCRHSAVVYQENMYIFGGTDGTNDNNKLYKFSLANHCWTVYKNTLTGVDSHSAVVYHHQMIVFGGYQKGIVVRQLLILDFTTFHWEAVAAETSPQERAGHSAIVYNGSMWIYGGISDHSEYFSDFWRFDLELRIWEKINIEGDSPGVLTSHTACIYRDFMLIFGGLKDILKETNDFYSYNFQTGSWTLIPTDNNLEEPAISPNEPSLHPSLQSSPRKHHTNNKSDLPILSLSLRSSEEEMKAENAYAGLNSSTRGRIKGKIPHPRDGHTATIIEDSMIIFGGDRYQMPCNDLYCFTINENLLKKYF